MIPSPNIRYHQRLQHVKKLVDSCPDRRLVLALPTEPVLHAVAVERGTIGDSHAHGPAAATERADGLHAVAQIPVQPRGRCVVGFGIEVDFARIRDAEAAALDFGSGFVGGYWSDTIRFRIKLRGVPDADRGGTDGPR